MDLFSDLSRATHWRTVQLPVPNSTEAWAMVLGGVVLLLGVGCLLMWLRGRAQPTPKRTFLDRATAAIAKVMDAPRGAVDAAGRALGDGARAIVNFLATFACLIGAPVLSVIGQWQTALALFLLGLGVWIWLRLGNLGLVMLGIAIVGAGVGVRLSHAESVIKHWLGY